jgi:DNA repair protein RadC
MKKSAVKQPVLPVPASEEWVPIGEPVFESPVVAPKPKSEQGSFSRGFETSMRQIPQTAGGALALGADLVGATSVRDFGLKVYEEQQKKIQDISQDSDSFSNVIDGNASPTEFLKYGVGYVGGQALSAIGTGGVGALIGRKLVEKKLATEIGEKVAQQQLARAAGIGGATTLGAFNLMQTSGSIFPEAIEQAAKEGRELDAGDKARVIGASIASAGVETAMDMLGIGKVLKGVKGEAGAAGLAKRAAIEIPKGMAREGVTEGIQTGIERYGAGKELTGAEANREYVDSVALGALGGGLAGAAASVRREKQPEIGPLSGALNSGLENQAQQIDQTAATINQTAQTPEGRAALEPLINAVLDKSAKDAKVDVSEVQQALSVPPIDSNIDLDSALEKMHRGAAKEIQGLRSFAPEKLKEEPEGDLGMQNRDRTRDASVAQIKKIAATLDYDRMGVGKSTYETAPMVSVAQNAQVIPEEDFGKEDRVTMGDGTKFNVRYAVVEADSVLASHDADGNEIPEYFQPAKKGRLRALNNARTIAAKLAYQQGTAERYRKGFIQDGLNHGIALDSIASKNAPILIRVYDDKENARPNIGALSNPEPGLGFSSAKKAFGDAKLLDLSDFVPSESGDIDTPENAPALNRFALAIQQQGGDTADVKDRSGRFTTGFTKRFKNAVFAKAYKNQELVEVAAETADPDIKNILSALQAAAPNFAAFDDAQDLEVRPKIVDAVGKIRDARARGLSLEDYSAQTDFFDQDELTEEMVRFLWANQRAPKRLGEGLKAIAKFIDQELQSRQTIGMFGDEPNDIEQIKGQVNKFLAENYGDIQRIEQKTERYAAKSAQGNDAVTPGSRGSRGQSTEVERTEVDDATQAKQRELDKDRYVTALAEQGLLDLFEKSGNGFEKQISRIIKKLVVRPDADKATQDLASGSLKDLASLIKQGSVLAAVAAEQFKEAGTADLIGSRITSARDLAALSQVLRDSRFETMRYIFVKDGKIAGHTAISSRLASSVGIFAGKTKQERDDFKSKIAELASKADGYYLLHNHPSGDPQPSQADKIVTIQLAADVKGFLGHVVIDTNQYSVINSKGESQVFNEDFGAEQITRAGVLAETVTSPHAVAKLGAQFKRKGWVTLVAADANLRVNGVMEVPEAVFADVSKPAVRALITKFGRDFGATNGVFMAGVENDLKALEPLVLNGSLVEAVSVSGKSLRNQMPASFDAKKARAKARANESASVVLEQYDSSLDLQSLVAITGTGKKMESQEVLVEDTNKKATIKTRFDTLARELDDRFVSAKELLKCL